MSLNEILKKYYPSKQDSPVRNNCASGLLKAMNEYYQMNLGTDAINSMKVCGGGLAVGSTCGLLIASYIGIGHLYESSFISNDIDLKELLSKWFEVFQLQHHSTLCCDIKDSDLGCGNLSSQVAVGLEEFINEHK